MKDLVVVVVIAAVAIAIGAYLVMWFRTARDIGASDLYPTAKALWLAAILCLPFAGPLLWWAAKSRGRTP